MPRFLAGDELGSIKSISYDQKAPSDSRAHLKTLYDGTATGRARGIQRLSIRNDGDDTLVRSFLSSRQMQGKMCQSNTQDR